jgi:hypothetical protein
MVKILEDSVHAGGAGHDHGRFEFRRKGEEFISS